MEEKRVHQAAPEDTGPHANSTQTQPTAPEPQSDAEAEQEMQANVETALTQAQAHIAELKEDFLRAKAETENLRRRTQEDLAKAHKFAIERFAEYLLPVVDSLEAALGCESDDVAKVRDGVELTLRQLNSAFDKGRVIVISPEVGEKFDPHRHQAIATIPAEQAPNTVVTVLQKGYLIADRVLRPALVTVCQAK